VNYAKETEALVLARLKEMLEPALAPWMEAGDVLDYRAWPSRRRRMAVLTVLAVQPQLETTGGYGVWVEVAVTLSAQYQTSDAGLEQAERDLGEMSGAVFETLAGSRNELWLKAIFDRPWDRPPTPRELASTRIGICYAKLLLR
jgi:hypothetical protein